MKSKQVACFFSTPGRGKNSWGEHEHEQGGRNPLIFICGVLLVFGYSCPRFPSWHHFYFASSLGKNLISPIELGNWNLRIFDPQTSARAENLQLQEMTGQHLLYNVQ